MKKSSFIRNISFCFALASRLIFSPNDCDATSIIDETAPNSSLQDSRNKAYFMKSVTSPTPFPAERTIDKPSRNKDLEKLIGIMKKQTYWGYNANANTYYRKSPESKNGWCARYLRLALKKIGIIVPAVPAKDYSKTLPNAGFEEVSLKNYTPEPGHIFVIDSVNQKYPYGHVSLGTYNSGFISDFMEKRTWGNKQAKKALASAWPYAFSPDLSKIRVFRHPKLTPYKRNDRLRWKFTDTSYLTASFTANNANIWNNHTSMASQYTAFVNNKIYRYLTEREAVFNDLKTLIASATPEIELPPVSKPLSVAYTSNVAVGVSNSPIAHPNHRIFVPTLPCRKRKVSKGPEELTKLNEQWHNARKEVLKRNASIKNGQLDQIAHANLRRNVLNMYVCIPAVSKHDPVTAFKAARYVFNKLDLLEVGQATKFKAKILKDMAEQICLLGKQDKLLAEQAAKFVFKNAGIGELREQMRKQITPSLQSRSSV
ncbi:MAG: hypothetical protein RBT70_09435 [Alphaproteobacteria bacterium]|jgi:hypothetical protein|nr:hypothetical protein [Alphaproteobacteria bacterium]